MQKTQVIETVASIQKVLNDCRILGKVVGFVPTMGALHEGHISLVKKAKENSDVVVVSIFVNPTQFNNPDDLEKYPRTLKNDVSLLSDAGVPYVFAPKIEEIYPDSKVFEPIPLGNLTQVMEAAFRPGHFDGVIQVVKRLFDIIEPDIACFGKKDFQQLAVINFMRNYYNLPITIIGCEVMREPSGLAMSSRNVRLSATQREEALHIYEVLVFAEENALEHNPIELKKLCISLFEKGNLKLEYLEIVHPDTLLSLSDEWVKGAICCIACFCGEVRLIDNMQLV